MKRTVLTVAILVLAALGSFTHAGDVVVALPNLTEVCEDGSIELVPITVTPADGVIGMNFEILYESTQVVPVDFAADGIAGDCGFDWTIPVPGELAISIFCVTPLVGSGVVANIAFQAVTLGPATSLLTWQRHDLNEGAIPSVGVDGQIGVLESIECVPLAVTYESTSAVATRDGVLVSWVTASEVDTIGFRVLRVMADGREKRLQTASDWIWALGSGLEGTSYEFLDDSRAGRRAIHYYLEDMDLFGRVERHGPIVVDRGVRALPTPRGRGTQSSTR